jgi:hypothetical protein
MLRLSYVLKSFILISLVCFGCFDANSSAAQNQPQLSVNGGCNVSFDPKTSEVKLVSKITVNAQSRRARCIIRIKTPNAQKQFRLVPLALKGEVKKAPATVAISSILIGGQPTSLSKKYTNSTKFDLTNQIPKTNYTSQGKSVFGINLVLTTTGGELELTDMRFALQQR